MTVERIKNGWRIPIKGRNGEDTAIEVVSPRIDRGHVRGALTVRVGSTITYRDTINLTSRRARAKLLIHLAEKGITLEDDRPLVALDEACRRPPAKDVCDAPPNVSETVRPLTLAQLEGAFRRWLLITDRDFLPVLVGAALAHRLESDPVWLLLVAPPGGTKTEPLRSFYGCTGYYALSELTAKTFASGLDTPNGHDPSLLARLTSEILILKDFTTVLEMRRDDRQAILAQLREIYDGRFDKAWGTGRELTWEGRLGFLGGVTPIIDKHQGAMSILGERFVLFRPTMPDRKELARAALRSRGHEREMRRDLATAMRGFLAARSDTPPAASSDVLDRIAEVADFITRARSGVQRDGYRRELEYTPAPEAPTRFAKVLLALASGIALAYDRPTVTGRELGVVLRVALDCLPAIRHRVIAALVTGPLESGTDEELSTSTIAEATKCSSAAIRRTLEDLQALDVVTCEKVGPGKADTWRLAAPWGKVFGSIAREAAESQACAGPPDTSETVGRTFSEMSDPPAHPQRRDGTEEAEWTS